MKSAQLTKSCNEVDGYVSLDSVDGDLLGDVLIAPDVGERAIWRSIVERNGTQIAFNR